jgi:hypothetical protein
MYDAGTVAKLLLIPLSFRFVAFLQRLIKLNYCDMPKKVARLSPFVYFFYVTDFIVE